MMRKYIVVLFLGSFLQADILFTESFDDDGVWPTGWTFDEYINPETGEVYTSFGQHNWRVDGSYQTDPGFTPPAAVFLYYPRIPLPNDVYLTGTEAGNNPQSALETSYELSLQSPDINVGNNTAVMVEFTFSLDYWDSPTAHINGMIIEADGGSGWSEMLKYEVGGLGAGDDFDATLKTETFIVSTESGVLKLRWKAYGTDSYFIDAWVIDNIKVITLPKLSYVHIESNNTTDNQSAVENDEVTLTFTSEQSLLTLPYVQINGSETVVVPQGGNSYVSDYIVSGLDADGPLTFTIDFTALDGAIDGATVKNTTDNSRVTIDRTPPPPFDVADAIITQGGNVFSGKWNSTNTGMEIDVTVPEDSSVVDFNYFQGNSISFDGVDDRVVINGNSIYKFSSQFTVEAWIKPNSTDSDNYRGIISFGKDGSSQFGWGFAYYATGWRFFIKTQSNSVSQWTSLPYASAPSGQWTHLAATYDGSKLRLYKNGSIAEEKDVSGQIIWPDNSGDLYIGSFNKGATDYYFSGNIDDVRLWNTVRSGSQIKGNKAITLEGSESGLVSYWKADEASGTTLNDESANQIDGTLSGASFVTLNSPINFSNPVYDNTVIIGSNYKLRTKIGANEFQTFDDFQEITLNDFSANQKTISGSSTNFSNVPGYQHGQQALISAVLYDQSGNSSLGDTSAMVLEIDLIANDPTSVSITSDNTNSAYAKTGDMVTITMSYDEDINSTSSSIESNSALDTDLGSEQFKAEYTLAGSEPEGVLDFVIDALDYMGNPGSYNLTTDGSQVTYDKTPPELTYVNISSNNADTSWAKVSDSIIIAFTSSEVISLDSLALIPAISILGQMASVSDLQNNKFSAVYVPTDSDAEGEATFEIQFSDLAGNDGVPVTVSTNNTKVMFDKTPPADFTVGLLTPTGGNQVADFWNLTNTGMDVIVPVANDTTLKNGTVQLYGKVGSNNFEVLGNISTILPSEINADKTISIAGDLIEGLTGFAEGQTIYIKAIMNDRPGNSKEGSQSITEILIDETPATITPISIISNNNNSSLAKVGDLVTVSFSTSESLIDTVVKIEDQLAIVSGLGSNQFIGVYEMGEANTEGIVPFEISFIDFQGNPFTISDSTTDASQVTFDKTKPTLDPVTITSDNSCSAGAIAKAENIVTINFTSLEPLLSTFSIIMSDTVSVIDLGSSQYKIDHQLAAEDVEGDVTFLIRVTDLSGNISEDIITTTDGSSVDLDLTLPILDYVHIESNNSYSSIAVLGDIVTLTFEPTEPLSATTVIMSGTSVTATENNGVYSATYTIQESDMLTGGFLSFAIDFTDCPGNVGLTDSTTSDESFVSIDVGPPEMVSVKIFSSNQDSSWSKVGDSVFVLFVVNEPLKIDGFPSDAVAPYSSLKIGENSVELNNIENTSYQGFYIMPEPDNEGQVSLEISFYDLGSQAGNDGVPIQATTNNSKVIFDKTDPQITTGSFVTNNSYGDSLAKVGDVGSINISLNENLRSISAQIDGDSISMNGGSQNFSYSYIFSDSNANGNITLNMLALDSAGNQADTIINRVYFDKTVPQLSSIFEGSINEDKVYSRYSDSLQLAWSKIELESGIRGAYIGLGSDSGLVDIANWVASNNEEQGSLVSLSLSNNSKYFGAIFLEDNVGNISDSLWGNGITIDLEAPTVGTVWDGFLDEDIDYTADSNQLFVRWKDFTDNQSIDFYEAAIGSNNDTINIASWQKSTDADNIQITGLNLDRGIRYFSYLRAVDSAANISSVLKSDGVEFDNTPPDIKSIYPLFDSLQVLSVINNDEIKINFNKPILKFGFTVSASQDSNLNYSTVIQDSGIIISILDILPSYETITVNLDTAIAFNLLNYTDTMTFKSKLWGDLNGDYKISVEDVLFFNQSWLQSSTDLGPVSGNPPYLFPSPDGDFGLNDLAAFGKMWIWYYHEYQTDSLFVSSLAQNSDIKTEWGGNTFKVAVPENSYGAEIIFFNSNFDLDDFHFSNRKNSSFYFTAIDSNYNSVSYIIADKNGLDSTLNFNIKNLLLEKFSSSIKYRFIDSRSDEIVTGIEKIDLIALPQSFTLFQNYPNPFNGETVIKYELPKSSNVDIKIYDIVGREIFSKWYLNQEPGVKRFTWKGLNSKNEFVSSGVYFFQISSVEKTRRMKMILLK